MEMAMPNDLTEAELLENIEAFRKGQKVFVSEMYHVAIDEVCDLAIEGLAARRWPTDGIEQSFQSNFDSPATQARGEAVSETYLTVQDVLDAHAEVGQLDYHLVKKAMGPNWPKEWDGLGPGDGIFHPDEDRKP
jgi:hypothetical protein